MASELLTGIKKKYKAGEKYKEKMLTIYVQHLPRAEVDRLYVPRKEEQV
jgi:hypothetical protein